MKALREQFPLEILLPLISLKRSTFFYHLAEKVDKNAEIVQKVAEIYHENHRNYGYRRITLILRKMWTINHKKVQAIMQKLGLTERNRYCIPTKAGSIKWQGFGKFANKTALGKVCREKETAWIMGQWKVFWTA